MEKPLEQISIDAVSEIMNIMSQIASEGAVDSELETLRNLLSDLHNKKINNAKALEIARQIHDKRQNYH